METEEGTPSGEEIWAALFGGNWPDSIPGDLTSDEILKSISAAGIVGLGGAAFPTQVKLHPAVDKPVQTLLLNGCECEPYLTADDRLMREAPRAIIAGARLAMIACGAREIVMAIEDNKPEAIAAMRDAVVGVFTMMIRWFGGYPEGVMFSVLLANAVVPLIDRATPTTPVGGKVVIR